MEHGMRWFLICLTLTFSHGVLRTQPPEKPAASRAVADLLRSPRETIRTLYFSQIAYDFIPAVIDDAVACLELSGHPGITDAEAVLMALDLEAILNDIDLPVNSAPEHPEGDTVIAHDSEGFRIVLQRGMDGLWRFDRDTVGRIPAMKRAMLIRVRNRQSEVASLRPGFTDAGTTMRRFFTNVFGGDFYGAANALDLSGLTPEERRERGPFLAQQLAFVIQRRGWVYFQEVASNPLAPPYTWNADRTGRIMIQRVPQSDGKDAWLFSRQTIQSLPRMYEATRSLPPDPRYVRLGVAVESPGGDASAGRKAPASVPAHLGSPREVLKGFFKAMDEADTNDARVRDSLEYLDLRAIAEQDRLVLGGKLASKLEALLRRAEIELASIPDTWNAPPQFLGEARNFHLELSRQPDGCWRFTEETMGRVPALFDKLSARDRLDRDGTGQFESARDTIVRFLTHANQKDPDRAAACLDLSEIPIAAQDDLGPILAVKLEHVLNRLGRIYIQEVPDDPEGPRYVHYRGELGRIIIARRLAEPRKGAWLFTTDTVQEIERMFWLVEDRPLHESLLQMPRVTSEPRPLEAPGVWLRLRLPSWAEMRLGPLDLYQWLGMPATLVLSWALATIVLSRLYHVVSWLLRRGGSELSVEFVQRKLRPLTWLTALQLFLYSLIILDIPMKLGVLIFPAEKFLMAFFMGWLGFELVDLVLAIYTNSELLNPHRSLGDLIVPVSMRLLKALVVILVAIYVIYQVGEGDLLGRFLTGLGVAGLAASLAAQDVLKSFFGTLLLIGERSFKIGDRILVGNLEGIVELVGFRSTRLRTGEDSLLTVPNSIIASASIDNMGARAHRRFRTNLQVAYATTPEKLTELVDKLRQSLSAHPKIRSDKVEVHIQRLAEKGIEIGLNMFLLPSDDAEELRLRDEIQTSVLRQAQALDVTIAPAAK